MVVKLHRTSEHVCSKDGEETAVNCKQAADQGDNGDGNRSRQQNAAAPTDRGQINSSKCKVWRFFTEQGCRRSYIIHRT